MIQPTLFEERIRKIIEETAAKYGFTVPQMIGPRRAQKIARARFEAYWRADRETGATLKQIGRAFGNRDHATILNGIARQEEILKEAANGQT